MTQQRFNFQTGQYEECPDYLQSIVYNEDWDDDYSADDYDRRDAIRNGWTSDVTGRW